MNVFPRKAHSSAGQNRSLPRSTFFRPPLNRLEHGCLIVSSLLLVQTLFVIFHIAGWMRVVSAKSDIAVINRVTVQRPAAIEPKPVDPDPNAAQRAELQKEFEKARADLKTEITENDSYERGVLDRIITLVGIYSGILGLTGFFALRSAREEADALVKKSKETFDQLLADEAAKLAGARAENEKILNTFRDDFERRAKSEVEARQFQNEEFQTKLWSELPEMRNLKDSLRDFYAELGRLIPAESDWTDEKSYLKLNEADKQRIFVSESTIGALQLFLSKDLPANRDTAAALYRRLARFYFSRYTAKKESGDAERADLYLIRSMELDRNRSTALQLRGSFFLTRKWMTASSSGDIETAKAYLDKAETNLLESWTLDSNQIGAAYNLALVYSERDRPSDALKISLDAIERLAELKKTAPDDVRKWGPYLYFNAACFLAKLADQEPSEEHRSKLRMDAINLMQRLRSILEETGYLSPLQELTVQMAVELAPNGNFNNFTETEKTRLDQAWKTPDA